MATTKKKKKKKLFPNKSTQRNQLLSNSEAHTVSSVK